MDSMSEEKYPKAKLPRKRKKAAIKAQGRKWYHDTIKLFNICQKIPRLREKRCKFWVNSSVGVSFDMVKGIPLLTNEATKFW